MGILSVLLGLGLMFFSLVMSATAPGGNTLNLGLLNDRLIVAMIGLAFVVVGAAANVSAAIRSLRSVAAQAPEPPESKPVSSRPPIDGASLRIGGR